MNNPAPLSSAHGTFSVPEALIVSNRIEFRNQVLDAIQAGARAIVLDFAENAYTDSTGLAVLVTIHREAVKAGIPCTLINVGEVLRETMRFTRMDLELTIQEAPSELVGS